MDKTNNNATKGEENATSYKKLHKLVEVGELTEYQKRVAELRKRVEKLYSAERARLLELQEERARAEEERKAATDEAVKAEAEVLPDKSSEQEQTVAEQNINSEQQPSAAETDVQEGQQPVKEEKPAAEKTSSSSVHISEPPPSATRTAIPSYIRGVVKHTPRSAPTERPKYDGARRDARPSSPRSPSQQRPSAAHTGGAASRPPASAKFEVPPTARKRETTNKKAFVKPEDKRQMNKRTLIRKGYIQENSDEERMGTRKLKNKKVNKVIPFAPIKIEKAVITTENLTVKILSEKIGKTAQEIIKQLMELGIMTTVNSVVDFATMQLVADALGVQIELKLEKTKEEELNELHAEPDAAEDLVARPPIVTVMGHVDHGKTSLLDVIRKTSVAQGEAGGITQHIGAYSVDVNGQKITFLDTPGHAAFTEMRRRGANVTDIAVIIVAADDGVMPQTIEAVKHAQAAEVPMVVAVNKIDKPGANADKVKEQLANYDVLCEEWGGKVPFIPISAKKNMGIDKLLENIILLAEVEEFKANPKRSARGFVIEARLDKGKGPIATVIVQNGTLKTGDYIVSGTTYGRVRTMTDDKGKPVKAAAPSMPVAVYGLAQVPAAGDSIVAVENEKMARQVIAEREAKIKESKITDGPSMEFPVFEENPAKEYKVFIKADVQGSSEAIAESVQELSTNEVKVKVIHSGVGAITQNDVMMAEVSGAVIIGFNVKPDSEGRTAAERKGVKVKLYNIIYEALDDIKADIESMLAPKFVERITGRAIVRMAFRVSGVGIIAGSYVQSGSIVRNGKARLFRGGKQIFDGNIVGLKRFKDDAKEVTVGYECGIALADYTDFLEDDELECYVVEKETK